VAEIRPRMALSRYEHDIDAFSYEYKDERQKFYFFAQFANETSPVVKMACG
jgi:hypothetical protein